MSTYNQAAASSPAIPKELANSSAPNQESIAIVGMAVNMPGAPDASRLWEILEHGINTVAEIPGHRFKVSNYEEAVTGRAARTMKARTGNFIDDPEGFDAAFFKISPREARSMDPQARILLHTAYEALEDAGYVPSATRSFAPETFGCYVGVATGDYAQNLRKEIDVYYSTGTLRAFLSGRISYVFKWGGPSVVLDTACSSSMVSIHQACRALTSHDCNAAMAGGVNVITSPDMFLGLDRGHFLSPTGQCKAFDASADGYSRGEGCGLFVLKRLSDALAENDNILGVIRGVEVNQSGLAHSITHPHAPTQARLFRRLLERSGVNASRVNVVEAHGTGTQAGDPNELESIRSVLSVGRNAENPLHVTSVKANIGHLEAASGAASLAKLLLMLKHGTIPRQISLCNLNPRIVNLDRDHIVINREQVPWRPVHEGERRMAVLNNFGAAGSNAALLLEEYVADPVCATNPTSTFVFGISAKSPEALLRLRDAYVQWLQGNEHQHTRLVDIAYTATARRMVYDYRFAVTASSKKELVEKLTTSNSVLPSRAPTKIAFVFSGQGSQYRGMGGTLYQTCSLFREIVDECHSFLVDSGFPGVLQVLYPDHSPAGLSSQEEFEINQSAIFVLEYGMARLWMSWGVEPAVVVGHSLGEYVAQVVAGVLSLDDALKLIASRGRLMVAQCSPGSTSMLAVNVGRSELEGILLSSSSFTELSIACCNSPTDTVVSGALHALEALQVHLDCEVHVKHIMLSVPFGYHSRAMDVIFPDLLAMGQRVAIRPPRVAIVSNVLGQVVMPGTQGIFTPDYYARHCSEPVRFEQGITSLCQADGLDDISMWIEIGPHSSTLPMLKAHPLVRDDAVLVPSLRRKQDAWATLFSALAQLYHVSNTIRWRNTFAHVDARCTHLPAYPWSKTNFWVAFEEDSLAIDALTTRSKPFGAALVEKHAVLHRWVRSPNLDSKRTAVFETSVASLARAITGHKVGGVALCPASVIGELALAGIDAATERLGLGTDDFVVTLRDTEFTRPLIFDAGIERRVYTSITLASDDTGSWRVSSRVDERAEDVHSVGTFKRQPSMKMVTKLTRAAPMVLRQVAVVQAALDAESFSTRTVYDIIFPRVVEYGNEYRTIRSLRISSDGMEGYAVVQLPDDHDRRNFVIHPTFLDTLFHVPGFAANVRGDKGDAYICSRVEKIMALPPLVDPAARYGVYFRNIMLSEERTILAESYAIELDGQRRVVAHVKGIHFRRVALSGLERSFALAAGSHTRPTLRRNERYLSSTHRPSQPTVEAEITVKQLVAKTCDIANIDPFVDLDTYGVDSLMSIEICHKLILAFPSVALDAKVLQSCTTVGQLIETIVRRLPACSQTATPPSTSSGATRSQPQSVATSADARAILATTLGVSVYELADDVDLDALGLDSLTAIEATMALQTAFERSLPKTLFESVKTVKDALDVISDTTRSTDIGNATQLALTPPHTPPACNALEPMLIASETHARLTKSLRLNEIPVLLQAGTGTPLFLVHDGSGVVNYLKRVEPLGRALWGLNNPHFLDGASWDSLETMAGAYAQQILATIGGPGPVIIGGWSFGGVVAFEAARQLRALGAPVRGVLLIDSPPPRGHVPFDDALITAIASADGRSPTNDLTRLVSRQFDLSSRLLGAYGANALEGPFEERVVLLRSREGYRAVNREVKVPRWIADRTDMGAVVDGWEEMLGYRIKVLPIPGNHFEVFAPQTMAQLSETIAGAAAYLDE